MNLGRFQKEGDLVWLKNRKSRRCSVGQAVSVVREAELIFQIIFYVEFPASEHFLLFICMIEV